MLTVVGLAVREVLLYKGRAAGSSEKLLARAYGVRAGYRSNAKLKQAEFALQI